MALSRPPGALMITRFAGPPPTRSRAVIHDGLVYTVAVSPAPDPTVYEQTKKALKRIDESLAMSGTDKSRILSAIVYLADIKQKKR
jgi:enamine deaminase RidA (YjgF/YER057c/UK114 family)